MDFYLVASFRPLRTVRSARVVVVVVMRVLINVLVKMVSDVVVMIILLFYKNS